MFDDPQKELKRLEEELLKLTEKDEKFERFYQEIFDEYGPTEEKAAAAPAPKLRAPTRMRPGLWHPRRKRASRAL